jgi:hypothetical protein
MITSDFKYAIKQSQIGNITDKILINVNTFGSKYTIDDIAVRVEGNLTQLQQATTISIGNATSTQYLYIPVNNSSSPVRIVDPELIDTVDDNGVYQGSYYVYSILTRNQRVVVDSPNNIYATTVVIEPSTGYTAAMLQDYSVLNGNILANRESNFIVQSDRSYKTNSSNTNPVNMYSIINNLATPAQVQDSNYTTIGWTNARYNGTKLTTTTNNDTDPILQGTFFEGAFFGKDIKDTYIVSTTIADASYNQYFFSGESDALEYTLQDLKLFAYDTGSDFTSLRVTASVASNTTPSLFVGDLLRISGSSNGFSSEIYEMIAPTGSIEYYPYIFRNQNSGDVFWTIQTKRNYNNTQTTKWTGLSFGGGTLESRNLYKIVPTRIYSIEGTVIQPTSEGKVRIKGTDRIVYINNDGYILSGSTTRFI